MKSMQLAAASGNMDSGHRSMMSMNDTLNYGLSVQSRALDHSVVDNPVQGAVLPMDEKALSGLQARMERLKSGALDSL